MNLMYLLSKKFNLKIGSILLLSTPLCLMPAKNILAHCTGYHPHHCGEDIGEVFEEHLDPHYETNKFDLKAEQEAGGWVLAWSDDISETDVINGAVAAGVSIYSGTPAFSLWVEELIDRSIASITQSANEKFPDYIQSQAKSLAQQILFDAIQAKSPKNALQNFDTVDFKAGAIRYTGGNYLGERLVGPHTWGMKIYLGFRVRSSNPNPNQSNGSSPWGSDLTKSAADPLIEAAKARGDADAQFTFYMRVPENRKWWCKENAGKDIDLSKGEGC